MNFFYSLLIAFPALAGALMCTTSTTTDSSRAIAFTSTCESNAEFFDEVGFTMGNPVNASENCKFLSSVVSLPDENVLSGTFYMDNPTECESAPEVLEESGVEVELQTVQIFYAVWQDGQILSFNRIAEREVTWVVDISGNTTTTLVGTNVVYGQTTVETPIVITIDNVDGTPILEPLTTTSSVKVSIITGNPNIHSLSFLYGCEQAGEHTNGACSGCSSTCIVYYDKGSGVVPYTDRIVSDTSCSDPDGSDTESGECSTQATFQLNAPEGSEKWTIFGEVKMNFGTEEVRKKVQRSLSQVSEVGGPLSSSAEIILENEEIAFETYDEDERVAILVLSSISYFGHALLAVRYAYISSGYKRDVPVAFFLLLTAGFVVALTEEFPDFSEGFAIFLVAAPVAIVMLLFARWGWIRAGTRKKAKGTSEFHSLTQEKSHALEVISDSEGEADDQDLVQMIFLAGHMPRPPMGAIPKDSFFQGATLRVMEILEITPDPNNRQHRNFDEKVKESRKTGNYPDPSQLTFMHHMTTDEDVKKIAAALHVFSKMSGGGTSAPSHPKVSFKGTALSDRVRSYSIVRMEESGLPGDEQLSRISMPDGIFVCGKRVYSKGLSYSESTQFLEFVLKKNEENPGLDASTNMSPVMLPQVINGVPGSFFSLVDWTCLLSKMNTSMINALSHLSGFCRVTMKDMKTVIIWGSPDECKYKIDSGVTEIHSGIDAKSMHHEAAHAMLMNILPKLRNRQHEGSVETFCRFFRGSATLTELIAQVRKDLGQEASMNVRHFGLAQWTSEPALNDAGSGVGMASYDGVNYVVQVENEVYAVLLANGDRVEEKDSKPDWLMVLTGSQAAPGDHLDSKQASLQTQMVRLDLMSESLDDGYSTAKALMPMVEKQYGTKYTEYLMEVAGERNDSDIGIARSVVASLLRGDANSLRTGIRRRSKANRVSIEVMKGIISNLGSQEVFIYQIFSYCEYKSWVDLLQHFTVDSDGVVTVGTGDAVAFGTFHKKWSEFKWNQDAAPKAVAPQSQQGQSGKDYASWFARLGLDKSTASNWIRSFAPAPGSPTVQELRAALKAHLGKNPPKRIQIKKIGNRVGLQA